MRTWMIVGLLAAAALGGDPSKASKKPKPFEWRQFYGNAAHDNYRPRPDQIRWPKVLWHVPGAAGQPTIANGLVYSGGEALFVIDARSGKVISERRLPDVRYLAAPVLAGHRVISRRSDGVLECHNARLRKLIWHNDTALAGSRTWVRGALLVNDLYIASVGVKVFAFGVKDGKLRWTQLATGGRVSMVPASDGTRVFFGTNAGDVLALDAGTGRVMWKVTEPGTIFRSSSPVVIDGRVIIGDRGVRGQRRGRVHCYDARSGKQAWAYDFGMTGLSTPGHADGSLLLGYGRVLATVALADGRPAAPSIPTGINAFGSPTLVGETIYFGNLDGNLYAHDRKTRRLTWRFEVPAKDGRATQASDFVHTGQRIYLSTSGGLYCLAQDPHKKGKLPQGERITMEPSE